MDNNSCHLVCPDQLVVYRKHLGFSILTFCLKNNTANHLQNTLTLSQDNTILSFAKWIDLFEGQSVFVRTKPTVIPYYAFLSYMSLLAFTQNTSLLIIKCLRFFSSTKQFSVIPAECPKIQLNSNVMYPEIASDFIRLSPIQMLLTISRSLGYPQLSDLATNWRFLSSRPHCLSNLSEWLTELGETHLPVY